MLVGRMHLDPETVELLHGLAIAIDLAVARAEREPDGDRPLEGIRHLSRRIPEAIRLDRSILGPLPTSHKSMVLATIDLVSGTFMDAMEETAEHVSPGGPGFCERLREVDQRHLNVVTGSLGIPPIPIPPPTAEFQPGLWKR